MRLGQVRKWYTILLLAAFVLGLLAYILAEVYASVAMAMGVTGMGCILAGLVLQMKFWRCPKCGELLPVRQHFYSVKHCPECGEELDFNRW